MSSTDVFTLYLLLKSLLRNEVSIGLREGDIYIRCRKKNDQITTAVRVFAVVNLIKQLRTPKQCCVQIYWTRF